MRTFCLWIETFLVLSCCLLCVRNCQGQRDAMKGDNVLKKEEIIPYLRDYVLLSTHLNSPKQTRDAQVHESRKCMKLNVRTKCAKYRLCLRPASATRFHMFTTDAKVYVYGATANATHVYNLRKFSDALVEGFAEDHVDSSVSGYIHEDRFYGRIFADGESYMIEPLGTFYQVQGLPDASAANAILYREVDMLIPPDYYRTAIDTEESKLSKKKASFINPITQGQLQQDIKASGSEIKMQKARKSGKVNGIEQDAIKAAAYTDAMFGPSNVFYHKRNYALVCSLSVVADDRFYTRVGRNDTLLTIKIMAYLIKETDYHFRAMDFNNDDRPDNIGFKINEMRLFTSKENKYNYLSGEHTLADDYLWEFSRYDFDNVCLGLAFTHRVFSNQVQGKAWVATAPPDYRLGGICQKRSQLYGTKDTLNLNTVAVSLSNTYLKLIPTPMAVTVLLHEMGHAFGAAHDNIKGLPLPQNESCAPGKDSPQGNYIMAPTSNDGRTFNNWIYSWCSKASITRVLETKSSCFLPSFDAYCGNGVVEATEECDCGTRLKCEQKQRCCGTPFSPFACRFRRDVKECPVDEPRLELPLPKLKNTEDISGSPQTTNTPFRLSLLLLLLSLSNKSQF